MLLTNIDDSTPAPPFAKKAIDSLVFKKMLLKSAILPVVGSIVLCILILLQFYKILDQNREVRHSDQLLSLSANTLRYIVDAETSLRGYLITADPEFLGPWKNSVSKIIPALEDLKLHVGKNAEHMKDVASIMAYYNEWYRSANLDLQYKKNVQKIEDLELIKSRKTLMDQIRLHFDDLYKRESKIRNINWLESEKAAKGAVANILGLGIFLGLLLAYLSYRQLRNLANSYNEIVQSLTYTTDHLEETIALRTNDLAAVNVELEAFSYSVSHDLRAPLRGIDGFSQILIDEYSDKLDGEALKYLKFIRQGVQKMGMLIDDLINLSRLSRSEFKAQKIDISLVAREVMKEIKKEDPQRKLIFKNFDSQYVTGDPGLIKIALQNLISNAWKYSSPKDTTRIELGKMTKAGKDVFYIKDNGVGFDMRFYDKLFQPFQRLHSKEEFAGTGIGLTTVARIIKRHGGSIWAESEPGVGSTFFFTLSS